MERDVRRTIRATEIKTWQRVVAVVALWSLVGLVMGTLRVTLTPNVTHAARMVVIAVFAQWIWIPVTPLVAFVLQRFPWRAGKKLAAFGAHAVLFAPLLVLQPYWLNVVVQTAGGRTNELGPMAFGQSDTNLVFYLLIVAGISAMNSYQRSLQLDAEAIELEGALSDAQVQVLTMQLQPHFLFNALHSVSESAFTDASAARKMLLDLRALLSESFVYAARREVTVADELRFLESYVAIQRQRFGDRISVMIAASADTRNAMIPHLLLQPLVENAIRHGISSRARGGVVHVRVDRDRDEIVIYVTDDGIGVRPMPVNPATDNGLGLAHTRARLKALHGDNASIALRDLNGQGAEVRVVVPYRTEPRAVVQINHEPTLATVDEAPSKRTWNVGIRLVSIAIAWALVAVLWAQIGALSNFFSVEQGPGFIGLLQAYSVIAAAGTALTLPAWWFINRLPTERAQMEPARNASNAKSLAFPTRATTRRVLEHTLVAIAFGLIHCWATIAILTLLTPYFAFAAAFAPLMRAGMSGWIAWDALVYFVALAIANRHQFITWHRARKLEAATTYAKLASARVDLTRLQLQPAVLLAGIDAVHNEIAVNPARSEEMIAKLGDVLRQMLNGATVDIELLSRELRSVA